MIQPLRRNVVVQEGNQIILRVPELKPGTEAEVTVFPKPETAEPAGPEFRRSSLIGSCKGMFKSAQEIDEFLDKERSSWDS